MLKKAVIFMLIALSGSSCSLMMPPQKIPIDRLNYLNAVSTSWKEQLLSNLVKLRYGDTLTFLEMTSITTAYSLDASLSAGYTTPWNPLKGTTGFRNQFVGGGAVTYSDKPTISYAPIRGEALSKTMLTPISLYKILKGLQTGFMADYIFPCGVKSINDLLNPSDPGFFKLAQRFEYLINKGVIRITIEEPKEAKLTKIPTEYFLTLRGKRHDIERRKTGDEQAVKGGTNPKMEKKIGEGTEKKKEEDDSAVGFLVLDKERAERENLEGEVKEFKQLLWSNSPALEKEWYDLFNSKCLGCHGGKDGNTGPASISSYLKSSDSNAPKFWVGDVDRKITQAVTRGHGRMEKIDLKPNELKALIALIRQAFERHEVYKIIDGNQGLPQPDPDCDKIFIRTRSILQILIALSELIEVPPEHIREGRVKEVKEEDKQPLIKSELKIKHSKKRPVDAFVAVQHYDYWFSINEKDFNSKNVFSSTEGILSMSEPGSKEGAPVLTIPVQ